MASCQLFMLENIKKDIHNEKLVRPCYIYILLFASNRTSFLFTSLRPHSHFFLNHQSDTAVLTTQAMIAIGNPHLHCSMPLMRFMPNMEVMKVGKRIIMLSDVSSRITVFMLLLIMLA